jgi:hypothetical protein
MKELIMLAAVLQVLRCRIGGAKPSHSTNHAWSSTGSRWSSSRWQGAH